ncbi:NPP1 family protein [Pendulispora brunnea]|uniref:NPP1 family protein n=1 Tax=Pendulispora brunnea TaxID=2905690 RepID=A0ABZ2K5P1_9BACT
MATASAIGRQSLPNLLGINFPRVRTRAPATIFRTDMEVLMNRSKSSTIDSNAPASRSTRMRRLGRFVLGSAMGAAVLIPSFARAKVLTPRLDQNADDLDTTYSPAYDYDRDGCYATAAISKNGELNPGLSLGGDLNGHCHDRAQIDNSNTYSRHKCNKNGWCVSIYASYFEKDQNADGSHLYGHTHDIEHVAVWTKDHEVKWVSLSHHNGWQKFDRSSIRFEHGTHPKVVYHKDGVKNHCFRLATGLDEFIVENVTQDWVFPALVGWNGYPSGIREKLMNHGFGEASFKIKDDNFLSTIADAKPSQVPFNPYED